MAVVPCSRGPTPVALVPPNGSWASPPGVPLLMWTMPVSIPSTKWKTRVTSLVKIDDLKYQFVGSGRSAVSLAPDHQALYISILRKEIQSLEEIRGLRRRRQRLEAGREDGRPPSISLAGPLHPPVTVEIGEGSEVIQEPMQGVVLTLGPDRKVVSGKLPDKVAGGR